MENGIKGLMSLDPVINNGIEYRYGWVLGEEAFSSVIGNQMAIIEAIGLPEKQENAVKSQLRQALYRQQRTAMFLDPLEVAEIGVAKGLVGENNVPLRDLTVNN